jgi:23S rRNA (cytosine1962-C5)-methyltransferase
MTLTAAPPPRVYLRPGGDKRLRLGHPWVYSNEIRMDDEAKALPAGTLASLHRVDGKPLGVGTFNPHCLIAFRRFTRDAGVAVDHAFLRARLEGALGLRRRLFAAPFYRLVHGDADDLPGLVVDRFGDVLAVQSTTAGTEALLPTILAALDEVLKPRAVVLRNDGAFRRLENLDLYILVAKGDLGDPVEVREGDLAFLADPVNGQKTGWFYDQRDNRAFMARLCRGARVLDLYCYGGGFAISAAAGGAAEITAIDSSEPALGLARRAALLNGVNGQCTFVQGNAFDELERLAQAGERFQVVIADPPAFVKSRKDLAMGLKGYRKLARLAAAVAEPGGFLFLASCSHNVDAARFTEESARGIAAAGRAGRIIRSAGAAPDHPVHPNLPESAYLKALVLHLD